MAVQCVEPDPEVRRVSRSDQSAQPRIVLSGPGAGFALPAEFHDAPGVVPPAVVVCARAGYEIRQLRLRSPARLGRRSRLARAGPRGAEDEKRLADGNGVMKAL